MTTDIERIAKEAGISDAVAMSLEDFNGGLLSKFAALIAEECAKECDSLADGPGAKPMQQFALDLAGDAIRSKFPMPKEGA